MASETKVVIIVLLILAVGFFYTNVRDKMTGYVPAQRYVDIEQYGFAADELDQALPIKQTSAPLKAPIQEEVSLKDIFSNAVIVNPCSNDIPSQIQTLVRSAC